MGVFGALLLLGHLPGGLPLPRRLMGAGAYWAVGFCGGFAERPPPSRQVDDRKAACSRNLLDYNQVMTAEKLRSALSERPFRPFTLHLADGCRIPVAHPEFVAQDPTGRTAVVYLPNGESRYVDLVLVTEIDFRRRLRRRRQA